MVNFWQITNLDIYFNIIMVIKHTVHVRIIDADIIYLFCHVWDTNMIHSTTMVTYLLQFAVTLLIIIPGFIPKQNVVVILISRLWCYLDYQQYFDLCKLCRPGINPKRLAVTIMWSVWVLCGLTGCSVVWLKSSGLNSHCKLHCIGLHLQMRP